MNRFNKTRLALLIDRLAVAIFLVYTDNDSALAFFLAGYLLFSLSFFDLVFTDRTKKDSY